MWNMEDEDPLQTPPPVLELAQHITWDNIYSCSILENASSVLMYGLSILKFSVQLEILKE